MLGFANLKEVWDIPKRRKEEILNMVPPSTPYRNKEEVISELRQTPPLKMREDPHIKPVFETMEPSVTNVKETPQVMDKEELVIRITNPLILNALKIYNDSYKEEMVMGIIEKALIGMNNTQETFITGRSDIDLFIYILVGIIALGFAEWARERYFMKH